MKRRDIAGYIFLAVTWGFSFLLLLRVVDAFGWVGAVTLRSLVAGSALLAAAMVTGRKLDFSVGWWPLTVVGATTVAGQLVGLTYATPRIGTAMAAIFVAAIPLLSMILAQLWGVERITAPRVVGIALGIGGIVLLVGFPSVPVTGEFVLGCIASLFSSLCAAFGSVYASRRLRATGAWEITIASFLIGGVMTLPLLLAVPVPAPPGAMDYFYLFVLGGIMSALTYVLYFRLVASIGATKAISVEFVVTVIAVVVGSLVLHERLTAVQFLGAAIIISGCTLVLGLVTGLSRAKA